MGYTKKSSVVSAFIAIVIAIIVGSSLAVASSKTIPPESASGVKQAGVELNVGSDGLTIEQRNIIDRLKMDNKTGSIKHLYIISAYSGQTIIYSTVKGKVTSSGKRLSPTTFSGSPSDRYYLPSVRVGDHVFYTNEAIQDDGTYGTSIEYLFWWDSRGIYHQHYVAGGQIIHISDQPLAVKDVIINMESVK